MSAATVGAPRARHTPTLRERQRTLSRDAIVEALVEHVSETGSFEVSLAEIAERAGVSLRTIYNHFPGRRELIDAVSDWCDERIRERGGAIYLSDLDRLPDVVARNFRAFEELSGPAAALARVEAIGQTSAGRKRRSRAFEGAIARRYPKRDRRACNAVAAAIRQAVSVRAWHRLTREHGLSLEAAIATTRWTVSTLTAALDRGEWPEEVGE